MPFPIHDTSRRGRVLNASFPYFRSPKYWYIDQLVCFPWFFLTSSRQVHGCMDTKLGYGPFHIKCKVHPTTCHEATEGEYRYSCTLSLTSVLDEGGWLMPHPTSFSHGNDLAHTVQEAGWAPGPVWTDEENLPLLGFDP